MKALFAVLVLSVVLVAQNPSAKPAVPYAEDSRSIDSIIHAMYDVISGPAGARNIMNIHVGYGSGDDRAVFVVDRVMQKSEI